MLRDKEDAQRLERKQLEILERPEEIFQRYKFKMGCLSNNYGKKKIHLEILGDFDRWEEMLGH